MITIDRYTDSGTLRFGSVVSSASGAAASQPVRPWTEKTTARANDEKPSHLLGSKTNTVTPPGPGLMKPEIARSRTISISRPPVTTSHLADSFRPRICKKAISGAKMTTLSAHRNGRLMLYCEFSSFWRMNPKKAYTGPAAIGEYRMNIQEVRKPARGLTARLT